MKNIRDLSKITGYSISTISRYINNSGYVSEKASMIIQDAIEQENFHINNLARTVFTKKSFLIGCILKHLQNPYYTNFLEVLDDALSKAGYQLIISHTQDDTNREEAVINNFINLRVDGIIIMNGNLKPEFYEKCPVKIIALNKFISPTIPFISTDDEIVGKLAGKYLQSKQVKNPAFIDYNYETAVGFYRYKGIQGSYSELNINVVRYPFDSKNFEELANTIYKNKHDGVFFYSDYMAIPTNNYLQKLDPNIVVASCDKIDSLKAIAPNIYSVEQNLVEIVSTAVKIIKEEEFELIHKIPPK